jgi:hypothetical protein
MNWKKCPSVRSGGKPFFYIRKAADGGKLVVAWSRFERSWIYSKNEQHISAHATRQLAQKFADCLNPEPQVASEGTLARLRTRP